MAVQASACIKAGVSMREGRCVWEGRKYAVITGVKTSQGRLSSKDVPFGPDEGAPLEACGENLRCSGGSAVGTSHSDRMRAPLGRAV